jgi:hypothetical protein
MDAPAEPAGVARLGLLLLALALGVFGLTFAVAFAYLALD